MRHSKTYLQWDFFLHTQKKHNTPHHTTPHRTARSSLSGGKMLLKFKKKKFHYTFFRLLSFLLSSFPIIFIYHRCKICILESRLIIIVLAVSSNAFSECSFKICILESGLIIIVLAVSSNAFSECNIYLHTHSVLKHCVLFISIIYEFPFSRRLCRW